MHSPNILLIFPSDQLEFNATSPNAHKLTSSPIDLIYSVARRWEPPLGLLYLASELLTSGYEVSIVDFNIETYSKDKLRDLINEKDIIGISVNTTGTGYRHAEVIVQTIRDINSEVYIIIGGQACTLYPVLIPGVDVLVLGEAELSIVKIIDTLLSGGNMAECRGVIFYDKKNGEIKKGLEPEYVGDLNAVKFPTRQIKDVNGIPIYGPELTCKFTTLITSRGCPFRCRFCAIGLHQEKYRERSIANVLDEIETIVEQGYKYLGVIDDHFLLNKRRAHGILDGILERKLKLVIMVQTRADSADEELYIKMRSAGVRVIAFGLESGNQDTLDFYNKKTTVEKNRYAVELADRCGMYVHGSFMLGAPMETHSHLERTFRFAKSLPLSSATFNTLDYLIGSKLWQEAREKGLIQESEIWVMATKERKLNNFDEDELTQIAQKATNEFYYRPTFWVWHLKKILERRDWEFIGFMASPIINSFLSRKPFG